MLHSQREPLKAYATITGTRRNMDALRAAGWGVLLNPYLIRDPKGMPYMLDNGAWTMFQIEQAELAWRNGTSAKLPPEPPSRDYPEVYDLETVFDQKFTQLLDRYAAGADMIVIPDRVASPHSLKRSLDWIEALATYERPLLLPVQNGMTSEQIAPLLGRRTFDVKQGRKREATTTVGIFVGGDTDWKLATMPVWGELARELGVPCHVGRVNTRERVKAAIAAGATSIDGTSATRYQTTLADLDLARRGYDWEPRGKCRGQLRMF